MNIIMLSPLPPPSGGIATWTLRYREYCDSHGINLRIVNIAMLGDRATSETMKKSIVYEIKRTTGIITRLKQLIKQDRPDVIHINTSCSRFGVIRDAICVGISHKVAPTIIHCHCNIEDQLRGSLAKKAFAYIIKKASAVIVLNSFSKRYVETLEKGKAIIIPNFLPQEKVREAFVVKEHITDVITVGHVETNKGLPVILDLAKQLPDITFTLVGAIRDSTHGLVIPNNVVFTGRINPDEVFSKLDSSDAFLLPTRSEGFSLAILEAMARGLPILTTKVGANEEMIEDKGGVLLKDCTRESIYEALQQVSNVDVRQKMSIWNINKVKHNYTSDVVMKRYFDLYYRIIERKEA